MRQPVSDPSGKGKPQSTRSHLENAAARGHAGAIKALEGPPPPVALEYLWEMFLTLDRMRGAGFSGPAPLSVADIDAADRMLDWQLKPHEVSALGLLDAVFRNPDVE